MSGVSPFGYNAHMNATKTFRNTAFKVRDYECTNIVACQGEHEPCDCHPVAVGGGIVAHHEDCVSRHWSPCDASILVGLTQIATECGVTFFGHL